MITIFVYKFHFHLWKDVLSIRLTAKISITKIDFPKLKSDLELKNLFFCRFYTDLTLLAIYFQNHGDIL